MKFWNHIKLLLSWIIVIALLATGALWTSFMFQKADGDVFPSIMDWGFATVASGSMEPQIPVGAILVIRQHSPYCVGDVVMYQDGSGKLITHRITEITDDAIITKGDANEEPDPPISSSQIIGKVQYRFNGFLYYYRRDPLPTVYGAIIIVLVLAWIAQGALKTVYSHMSATKVQNNRSS